MEQKVYLVTGEVRCTPYMGKSITTDEGRLVYASSATEAEEKFEQYWKGKSEPYSKSYFCYGADAREPIL
ncbi:hypothetical protein [Caulobacter phage Cr30]|uniref:hypothetical protein n=1 Tax=Caulobacter phage Cr30 TaxID=1357714 RepID=UPI0004A9B7C4|nr:hypothetical protein OZ74_gp086 [Caulobacter phage Cr30]AGS80971.1 hypothetical protein [Caulobacter phage Cr30]